MTRESRQRLRRWAVVLLPGLGLYCAPLPALDPGQRHLLALFAATILALVVRPVPMGVSVFVTLALLPLTGTVPTATVLAGFGNGTAWLVFCAFLFARAVTLTGLGERIAYWFISRFGHTSLTLGYSVAVSDLVLAPFVPSDTARGGGIIAPIVHSVARALGSEPGPTAGRIGSYLTLVGFHCTYTASAMFLTGMAANPLIAEFARSLAGIELTWGKWALAAAAPGLGTFALVPWLLHQLHPPTLQETEHARVFARGRLAGLGPLTRREAGLVLIMAAVIAGWISSPAHGVPNVTVALAGVAAILVGGVLAWEDLLGDTKAWDAFIWFAPLLMMAEQLSEQGVVRVVSGALFAHLHGWPWALSLAALSAVYLYAHYAFASMTAHVSALYPSFLVGALAAGVPAALAVWPLAFFSNLNAGLTHYGTGSAPVYFGPGYVTQSTWWSLGGIIATVNLALWLGVGLVWWRFLGLW